MVIVCAPPRYPGSAPSACGMVRVGRRGAGKSRDLETAMSLSSALGEIAWKLGEIAWKKEPRTCRADATPAEGAGRCVGTRGSGDAAEGNWLLLGAEVSRNLDSGPRSADRYGAWGVGPGPQRPGRPPSRIRYTQAQGPAFDRHCQSPRAGLEQSGSAQHRDRAQSWFRGGRIRSSEALRHRRGGQRFGTENCVGAGPHRHSFAVAEAADIGGGKACCP